MKDTKHLTEFKSSINFPPPESMPCPHPAGTAAGLHAFSYFPSLPEVCSLLPGKFLLLHNLLHEPHHLRKDFSEGAYIKSSPLYFHRFLPLF